MPTLAVEVVVMIGTLSPTNTLAFSLLRTRIRGFEIKFTSPVVFLKLTAGLGETSKRPELRCNRPARVNGEEVFMVEVAIVAPLEPAVVVVIGIRLLTAIWFG